jgi:hypothetical protein
VALFLLAWLSLFGAAFVYRQSRLDAESRTRANRDVREKRRAVTQRQLSWGPEGPALTVLGFSEVPAGRKSRIQLACRWNEPPSPWNRYELTFPGAGVEYDDGTRAEPLVRALSDDGFVIDYFFDHYPRFMGHVTIDIACRDTVDDRSFGVRRLEFDYWPDEGESALALPRSGSADRTGNPASPDLPVGSSEQ